MPFLSLLFWSVAYAALLVVCKFTYASFFEWLLHRFVMHKKLFGEYAYNAHDVVHHGEFGWNQTYHLINEKTQRKEKIPMAIWNGPLLIVIASVPSFWLSSHFDRWEIFLGQFFVLCLYYGLYEYMHWCMHLPKKRKIERTGVFFRLNGHHLLHHRYKNRNFNVVLPIADVLTGTLLLRSGVSFKQAEGPSVPSVQPKLDPRKWYTLRRWYTHQLGISKAAK